MPPPLSGHLPSILSAAEPSPALWEDGRWGRWLLVGGALRGGWDSCRDRHPMGTESGRDSFIFSRRQHLGTFPSFLLELPEPTQPGWGESLASWPLLSPTPQPCLPLAPPGGFLLLPTPAARPPRSPLYSFLLSSPPLLCPASSTAFSPPLPSVILMLLPSFPWFSSSVQWGGVAGMMVNYFTKLLLPALEV